MQQVRRDKHFEILRKRCRIHIGKHIIKRVPYPEVFGSDETLHGKRFHALGEDAAQKLQRGGIARHPVRQPLETETGALKKVLGPFDGFGAAVTGCKKLCRRAADRNGPHNGAVHIMMTA